MIYYSISVNGSSDLQTSVAGEEILDGKNYVNFQILNDQDCHIKINNKNYIFLRANQGYQSISGSVFSCKIEENSITFNWIGDEA